MTDEFEGIFDDATIADFLRETSARDEVSREDPDGYAFSQFVDEQLRAVRTAWIAAETFMQPLAIVATRSKQRIFIPDDDETLGQFVDRMHREAVKMKAVWTFCAVRTQVADLGDATDDEQDIDVGDSNAIEEAMAAGLLRLGVVWYAERRDKKVRQWRHGQMADEDGTLGELIEGAANQDNELFAKILGG